MKTEFWIWIVTAGFLVLELIIFIAIFRSNKKTIDEAKNKVDGQLLDSEYISEEEMGILFGEQPFIDCYKSAD